MKNNAYFVNIDDWKDLGQEIDCYTVKNDIGHLVHSKLRNGLRGIILSSISIDINVHTKKIEIQSNYQEIIKDEPFYTLQGTSMFILGTYAQLPKKIECFDKDENIIAQGVILRKHDKLEDAISEIFDGNGPEEGKKYFDIVQVYKPSRNMEIEIEKV